MNKLINILKILSITSIIIAIIYNYVKYLVHDILWGYEQISVTTYILDFVTVTFIVKFLLVIIPLFIAYMDVILPKLVYYSDTKDFEDVYPGFLTDLKTRLQYKFHPENNDWTWFILIHCCVYVSLYYIYILEIQNLRWYQQVFIAMLVFRIPRAVYDLTYSSFWKHIFTPLMYISFTSFTGLTVVASIYTTFRNKIKELYLKLKPIAKKNPVTKWRQLVELKFWASVPLAYIEFIYLGTRLIDLLAKQLYYLYRNNKKTRRTAAGKKKAIWRKDLKFLKAWLRYLGWFKTEIITWIIMSAFIATGFVIPTILWILKSIYDLWMFLVSDLPWLIRFFVKAWLYTELWIYIRQKIRRHYSSIHKMHIRPKWWGKFDAWRARTQGYRQERYRQYKIDLKKQNVHREFLNELEWEALQMELFIRFNRGYLHESLLNTEHFIHKQLFLSQINKRLYGFDPNRSKRSYKLKRLKKSKGFKRSRLYGV